MERDYNKDISVDINDLEAEWIEQPSLFLHYAEAHADAIHERDIQKSKMEYTYAKMYSMIKKNWEKFFDIKPTEPAIKEFITSHKKYKKAERAFINSTRDVNVLLSAKNAFEHRKRALENLVSLRITGYHSEPKNKYSQLKEKGGRRAQKERLNKNGSRAKSRLTKKKNRS